jgi:hypothetical protein
VVVVVLILLVVASLALVAKFDPSALSPSSPAVAPPPPRNETNYTVKVLAIDYHPSACWANTSASGATVRGGSTFSTSLPLTNAGTKTCIVNAASTITQGFSVAQSNTPLTVPPGKSGTLQLTIQTPDFDADQDLLIALTVSVLG